MSCDMLSIKAFQNIIPFHNKCLKIEYMADDILKYFSYFSQETGLDISCKLALIETICMKCHICFGGNKKNIINLSFVELAQVIKVKY